MVRRCIDSKKVAIKHVREPSDGVPHATAPGDEGPFDSVPSESFLDHWIVRNVEVIIQIYEGIARYWGIGEQSYERQ